MQLELLPCRLPIPSSFLPTPALPHSTLLTHTPRPLHPNFTLLSPLTPPSPWSRGVHAVERERGGWGTRDGAPARVDDTRSDLPFAAVALRSASEDSGAGRRGVGAQVRACGNSCSALGVLRLWG
eukprot:4575446-Pleurochrysis_carterae.AAC.1